MLKQPHYCGIYGKHQLQQGFLLVLWTALTCQGWNMFFNVPDGWRHTLLSPFKLDSVGSTSRGKEFKQTLNTLFLSLSIRSLSALILPTFLPSECCNPGNQPLWQEIKQDMTLWLEPWPRALRGERLVVTMSCHQQEVRLWENWSIHSSLVQDWVKNKFLYSGHQMYIQKIIDYWALHVFIILVPQSKSVFFIVILLFINSSHRQFN